MYQSVPAMLDYVSCDLLFKWSQTFVDKRVQTTPDEIEEIIIQIEEHNETEVQSVILIPSKYLMNNKYIELIIVIYCLLRFV